MLLDDVEYEKGKKSNNFTKSVNVIMRDFDEIEENDNSTI